MKYLLQLLYSYNKMIFISCDLEKINYEKNNDLNIKYDRIKIADKEIINKICEINYPAGISEKEIQTRLRKGHQLYLAKNDKDILCYGWVALKGCYIPYLKGQISLSPDEFYTYGAVVKKEYRGHGILNQYRKLNYHKLKEKGFRYEVTSYMSWNKSVERANKKYGYQYEGEIIYGYIFFFRYFINKMPKGKIMNLGSFWGKWKKLTYLFSLEKK